MENETRQSRHKQGMKTPVKVAIGVGLVLIAIGVGALVGMMINKGNNVVQKEEKQSAISRVESEQQKISSDESEPDVSKSDSNQKTVEESHVVGSYVFGSVIDLFGKKLLTPEEGNKVAWTQTTLGAGRDEMGYRDDIVNGAQQMYGLGTFSTEYMYDATPGGSMGLKYYNIVGENGYLTVSFYGGESGNKNISPKDRWQLVNVYKYN